MLVCMHRASVRGRPGGPKRRLMLGLDCTPFGLLWIFILDQTPNLDDRASNWPMRVFRGGGREADSEILETLFMHGLHTLLHIYAYACCYLRLSTNVSVLQESSGMNVGQPRWWTLRTSRETQCLTTITAEDSRR